jgi:hypothetical protein
MWVRAMRYAVGIHRAHRKDTHMYSILQALNHPAALRLGMLVLGITFTGASFASGVVWGA